MPRQNPPPKNRILWSGLESEDPVTSIDEFRSSILPKTECPIEHTMHYYQPLVDHIPHFAPGKYMWYIVERLTILQMGGMATHFTGAEKDYWQAKSPEEYFALIHPDDLPYLMTYAKAVYKFLLQIPQDQKLNFHPNIYFRLKNIENEQYKNVLFQYADWRYDENGTVESILHVLYDITHLEAAQPHPMLTILDDINETLYFSKSTWCEMTDELKSISVVHITQREKEIISLMAKGLSSKQISAQLLIAKNTVENHRQSILKKTGCTSSAEVIAYSLKFGFL